MVSMKINFDWHNYMSKTESEKKSYIAETKSSHETRTRGTKRIYDRTIVDISDKVTDDLPYTDQGLAAEKLKGIMDSEDYISIQRDFMTVMSNSMSASDFEKMKEDGFQLSSMEPKQAVTILDKIKTVLAQSGTRIEGYNDDLSVDKLMEIIGNGGYAQTIARELSDADAPVTKENIEQVEDIAEQAASAKKPEEESMVYLISQRLHPTLGNLYKAEHSSGGSRRQTVMSGYTSGGYGRQGETVNGARKTPLSPEDYKQIEKEIRNRLQNDGLEVTPEILENGKWLLEHGLAVTGENAELLQEIKNLSFPMDPKQVIKQAAAAIGEGRNPADMVISSKEQRIYEKAEKIRERYHNLPPQAADYGAEQYKRCSLEQMEAYEEVHKSTVPNLEARKLLEEVRLKMTVEANVKLLQSGFHIETAPMEDLIRHLDEAILDLDQSLFGTEDTQEKVQLYHRVQEQLKELPALPLSVIGKISFLEKPTLLNVAEEGQQLRAGYEKAKESYETIMTAPRSDLGDSIKKAFRNVDTILEDMDLEINEANRRAIRIMGYNQITITEDNLERVREADQKVRRTIEGLKPAITLSLIREGKNPLEMSMDQVQEYLTEHENDFVNDTEKYSEFLYKLDKKKGITEEEREAYIGIYRMLRQIEKSDGAVIGSLLEQGADLNFSNLLSAVRTRKAKHMDRKVDDDTGITTQVQRKSKSISEQIESGFLSAEETLKNSQTTPDEVLKEIDALEKEEELKKQFAESRMEEIREDLKLSGKEKEYLEMYHQPVTLDALQSVMVLTERRGETFRKTVEMQQKLSDGRLREAEEGILEKAEKFLSSLDQAETRESSYEDMIHQAKLVLEERLENKTLEYTDIREMQSVYKQLSVASNLAKEENFEIPVWMGNEITSINLKVVHSTKEKGEVRITMDSKSFGKVDARFVETPDGLEGSVLTDYMDGKEYLQSHADRLQEMIGVALQETKTEMKSLFFGTKENLDINSPDRGERTSKAEVSILYKVAKQFIQYVKDIEEV